MIEQYNQIDRTIGEVVEKTYSNNIRSDKDI